MRSCTHATHARARGRRKGQVINSLAVVEETLGDGGSDTVVAAAGAGLGGGLPPTRAIGDDG